MGFPLLCWRRESSPIHRMLEEVSSQRIGEELASHEYDRYILMGRDFALHEPGKFSGKRARFDSRCIENSLPYELV